MELLCKIKHIQVNILILLIKIILLNLLNQLQLNKTLNMLYQQELGLKRVIKIVRKVWHRY